MPELSLFFIVSAFVGGVAMFLAPCTLPIVPAFLASMVPDSLYAHRRQEIVVRTVMFVLGFSVIFFIFGLLSAYFGSSVASYRTSLAQIGSVFIILFGLTLFGLFELPFLKRAFQRVRMPSLKKGRVARPLVMGVVFALGWSPCSGPLLASILLLATQSSTVWSGGVLLLVFSFGLSIPFIFTGLLYAQSAHMFEGYMRYERYITKGSGIFLVLLGVLLLTQQNFLMSTVGFKLYDMLGIVPMCTYY